MNRFTPRFFLLIFPSFFAASTSAQTSAARVEETVVRSSEKALAIAPVPQHLFGTIALSTDPKKRAGPWNWPSTSMKTPCMTTP
jgi:hypothetical protein